MPGSWRRGSGPSESLLRAEYRRPLKFYSDVHVSVHRFTPYNVETVCVWIQSTGKNVVGKYSVSQNKARSEKKTLNRKEPEMGNPAWGRRKGLIFCDSRGNGLSANPPRCTCSKEKMSGWIPPSHHTPNKREDDSEINLKTETLRIKKCGN